MRSLWVPLIAIVVALPAWAVEFKAEVDRDEVALDESVSLKIVIQASGGDVPSEKPTFQAPNFEIIDDRQSQFVEGYFENGKVGARFTRTYTFVMRPKSVGRATISDISVTVGGQRLQAAPITITVSGGGQGTPPPRGYGGGGSGLRGSGKPQRGTPIFVRGEVDKNRAYKGEQVIVSYYLYSRAAQFNAQADKFPALPGFLKEELEMPIVQGRMMDDVVTLDGQVYKRVLLARFAAYPLKDGKLTVDPFGVKVTYYDARRPRAGDDFDEAEDLFQQFFHQMTPQTATVKSEPVTVEVLPLPQPAPENFTGAVGDFSVISAVDRYDLRANEALSLTLKVEGEGNLSTIDVPKITLPSSIEVFESRAQTRTGRGGTGVRVFEYVLIPRQAGDHSIPPIELSFFDPKAKAYVKKATEPIPIHVSEGDPAMAGQAPSVPTEAVNRDREIPVPEKAIQKIHGLKDRVSEKVEEWKDSAGATRVVLLVLLLLGVAGVVLKLTWPRLAPSIRKWRGIDPERAKQREWERLKQSVETPGTPLSFKEVLAGYERVAGRVYDALDARYHVGARALSRSELRDILVGENKMPEDQWNRIASLLEFTETVRFATTAGAVSEERVRSELTRWMNEATRLDELIRATKVSEVGDDMVISP